MGLARICTRDVISCHPSTTITEAAQLMRNQSVGTVVITQDDKPLGIITDRDIVLAVVAEGKDPAEVCCGEIMSKDLVTVFRYQRPDEALRLMADKHVRRLPVVEGDGRCVGIVTLDDCLVFLGHEINDCTRTILYEKEKTRAQ